MGTVPSLYLAIDGHHLSPAPWDQITFVASRFPNSMTIVPTVSSCLQRAFTELFTDADAPFIQFFSHSSGEGYGYSIPFF